MHVCKAKFSLPTFASKTQKTQYIQEKEQFESKGWITNLFP